MKNQFFSFLVIIAIAFFSCKDDKSNTTPSPMVQCTGGTGGNLFIRASTVHHIRPIPGCMVYIKYNTNTFPGDNTFQYDDSLKAADSLTSTVFQGLKCGKYYLYATGIDSTLDPTSWRVKGGVPVNTSKDSDTLNITVYVTED